jgi:hypothetical protein
VPFGSFDVVGPSVSAVEVSGWVVDPDTNEPIDVHVYVDGQILGAVTANASRPDVAAVVPGYGDRHGFNARLGRVGGGGHQVCVYAINAPPFGADNPLLGCRGVQVSPDPTGSFDSWLTSSPGIRVSGWATDADSTSQLGVHVYVDGRFAGQGVADRSRPDVGTAFPWVGNDRGYEIEVPANPGRHMVCTYGINAGPGNNALLGCKSIDVPDRAPFGSLDSVSRPSSGTVRVAGWTIDPDRIPPIDVHVYLNGAFAASLPAGGSRPDVGAAFPLFGPSHGYDALLATGTGPVEACVYAINWGPGWGNPLLGCRTAG